MIEIPNDVLDYLRDVFACCNGRVSAKVSASPNTPEESLDLTWIEHVSRYSSPVALPSDWIVKIETHYLGGMRHFYRWEIADIGVLVHLRSPTSPRLSKVALLQSKRLYPDGAPVREESPVDYEIGFARLADPEDAAFPIGFATSFTFSNASAYKQIHIGSDQVRAIKDYERDVELKVYYQLYNPWSVPFEQSVPLAGYPEFVDVPELGVRVVPARLMHSILEAVPLKSPRLQDLEDLHGLPALGWRLEEFLCDEFLGCRQGDQFESIADARIQQLFHRRSGAIAAAIAITIQAPSQLM